MLIAAVGVFISFDSKESGTLFGLVNGLISQLPLQVLLFHLDGEKNSKLTTVSIGGAFAALVSILFYFK